MKKIEIKLTKQEQAFYDLLTCPMCLHKSSLQDFPDGILNCKNCQHTFTQRLYKESVRRSVRMLNLKEDRDDDIKRRLNQKSEKRMDNT